MGALEKASAEIVRTTTRLVKEQLAARSDWPREARMSFVIGCLCSHAPVDERMELWGLVMGSRDLEMFL